MTPDGPVLKATRRSPIIGPDTLHLQTPPGKPGIRLPLQGSVDAPDITHAWGFHPGSRDPNRRRGQALAWQGDVTQRLPKLVRLPTLSHSLSYSPSLSLSFSLFLSVEQKTPRSVSAAW